MAVAFELEEQALMAQQGGLVFRLKEAVWRQVPLDTQAAMDRYGGLARCWR